MKSNRLKIILFFSIIILAGGVSIPPRLPAITVSLIYTGTGLMDENFALLEEGDLIQLIYAGPDGQIDPPQLMNGMPGGDDVLWAGTTIDSDGDGGFTDVFNDATVGATVYVRFFNAGVMGQVSYYGLSALHTVQDLGGFDFWDMTAGGLYLWTEYPFIVVPEPATLLTLFPALLVGIFVFFRRKKENKESPIGSG